MEKCEAVMIGGSAGSLEVLLKVVPALDTALRFPVIIVLHRKSGQDNLLIDLLAARTQLRVKELEEKEKIEPATLYIAPPNYHLLIESDGTFSLDASEKVNFSRPAIDVAFESGATAYGENIACILLSGSNSDGAKGLQKVAAVGGLVLIQNPEMAKMPYMPEYALQAVEADAVLNDDEIAKYINELSND